jgi:nitroimidazol reductase NimA-like FMN-containing flavoprotein (pyridoxamine 5'-phosphate oxidase superfamily)
MRLKEVAVVSDEAKRILASQNHGVLGTKGDDGYPYAVPVSYVYDNEKIYFHCSNVEGHKLSAIKNNPKVSFCVVEKDDILPAEFDTKFASAIAFGKARIIEDSEEMYEPCLRILEKYSPDYIEEGKEYIGNCRGQFIVVAIDIDHLTGKAPK